MKTKETIKITIKIALIIGWSAFLVYNLYLIRLLGNEYNKDPSNFVFFEDEMQRQAYTTNILYQNSNWIQEASLVNECKPMIYFKDFYFNKIDPFVRWSGLLILLTLISNIPIGEWRSLRKKINIIDKKLEDDNDEMDNKTK